MAASLVGPPASLQRPCPHPSPPSPVTRLVTPHAPHAGKPRWRRNAVVRLPPPPPERHRQTRWLECDTEGGPKKDTARRLGRRAPYPWSPPPRLRPPHARARGVPWRCRARGGWAARRSSPPRAWAGARAPSTHPPACLLHGGVTPSGGLVRGRLAGWRLLASPSLCGGVVRGGCGGGRGGGRTWPRPSCVRVRVAPLGQWRPSDPRVLCAVVGAPHRPGGPFAAAPRCGCRALWAGRRLRDAAPTVPRPPPHHLLAPTTAAVAAVTVAAATTAAVASPPDGPAYPLGTTTALGVTITAPAGIPLERFPRARNRRPARVRA